MTAREAVRILTLDPTVGRCTPAERREAKEVLTTLCDTVDSCREMLTLALQETVILDNPTNTD